MAGNCPVALIEGFAHLFLKGRAFEGGSEVHVGADEEFVVVVVEEDDAVALSGDANGSDFGGGGVCLGEGAGNEAGCCVEDLLGVEFAGEFRFALGGEIANGGVAVGEGTTVGVGDHAVKGAGTEVQGKESSGQGSSTLGGWPGSGVFSPFR